MPSVCIHVRKAYSESEEIAIMNAVQDALVTAFGVKPGDRNITLVAHRPHRFMCPPDRDDPERYTNVTVIGHASRSAEAKRRFYAAVVDNLEALGIPRNCSLIQLHELPPGDIAIRGGHPMTEFPAMIDAAHHTMTTLSVNAQLVSAIFEEVAKGNGAPFWEACHEDIVWRTIGEGSWSGEFVGKQTIIDEIFRPLNRVLVERATLPTRLIDGGDVVVLQARGRNLTRDGQRYDNDYAFVIHFRDGKIARYEEYCDTDLIARVLPDRIAAKSMSKPA